MNLDVLKDFTEPSVEEENKIAPIANELYNRIAEETERLLRGQLLALGVNIEDPELVSEKCKKAVYPLDSLALASYEYDGKTILGIRISENRMSIEFDIPTITTETQKGEVQDV